MAAGRFAGWLSRLTGRGGTALPGLIAERLCPTTIEQLVASTEGGVVVVTGTNGKTTTTKMLVRALEAAGRRTLTNRTGSNLARGLATTLIEAASWRGRVPADVAVFEIDEAAVRTLAPRLDPVLLVVTNLARDQLDRFGELATTAGHVAAAAACAAQVVCNADDPPVAEIGDGLPDVLWYGAAAEIRATMPDDRSLYGDAGAPLAARDLDARLEAAEPIEGGQRIEVTVQGERVGAHLRVPGAYNGYNAAAALLAAAASGIPPAQAAAAIEGMEPAFGRGQVIEFRGRRVTVLLVKNPAGFNQAIRLLQQAAPMPVLIAINDLDADGRDVSWLWDARVEDLAATGHRFGTAGIRAHDMALRCKYAGIDARAEPDLRNALHRVVDDAPPGAPVAVVPTYTAMLALLDVLLPDASRREVWT
jgi:UDP-N-acetylmuramyl tripeptide synthase